MVDLDDNPNDVLELMPYSEPFLFVTDIMSLSETEASGSYRFKQDEYFYRGHFVDEPVTPGVILTECMAQIGLVAMGLYIQWKAGATESQKFAFVSSNVEFLKPVLPGTEVRVWSERIYYRLGKLKCKVELTDWHGDTVARGELAGMLVKTSLADRG